MSIEYKLVSNAAGASRLYLGRASKALVSEHRDWLNQAYSERAAEAPGVVKLLGADGGVKCAVSGWALGGPRANGQMTWIEEAGEEYHYRVARTDGAGAPLNPPDDYWAVAAAVGHATAPAGAVVLWRPAPGASPRDPGVRRDELWIAAVDLDTGSVVKTRDLGLTLPWDRASGVVMGGPAEKPLLLLIGLPDPGGPGAYRALALRFPSLEVAWESPVDIAAAEAARPKAPSGDPEQISIPVPGAVPVRGNDLRKLYAVMAAALGDGSGWLLAHGGLVDRVLETDLCFFIGHDGHAAALYQLHIAGTDELSPIVDQPGVLLLGKGGNRHNQHFISVDAVWPRNSRVETLADQRTDVRGRALGSAPELVPMSAALRDGVLFVAPPVGGQGIGADSADVKGLQTTPVDWHQAARPRVRARQQWLEDSARR